MSPHTIGVNAQGGDAKNVLATIQDLEKRGIPAAWLTGGPNGLESLTMFAAAAAVTDRIKLGTSIIPTWPRHPIIAAQQTRVIAQLAPGRFRLGLGPSHKANQQKTFGVDYRTPLTALREYIGIVRDLFETGAVRTQGSVYTADTEVPDTTPGVPIMASALRERSYEVCGEVADGAISWVSPGVYLRDVALPALQRGAKAGGRPTPPLIAHVPVCAHDNADEVRTAVQEQLGHYPKSPFYQAMFAQAGHPEAAELQGWSDGMIESVVFAGSEEGIAARFDELFSWGASEVICSIVTAGSDTEGSRKRTLDLLTELAKR